MHYQRADAIVTIQNRNNLVRSGWESPNRGSMRKVGYNGYLRSSIATTYSNITTATTYEAGVYNTSLNLSNGLADRLAGISIRCLAY